jgi:hypothetical protein
MSYSQLQDAIHRAMIVDPPAADPTPPQTEWWAS